MKDAKINAISLKSGNMLQADLFVVAAGFFSLVFIQKYISENNLQL